jgi:hypothetical protein
MSQVVNVHVLTGLSHCELFSGRFQPIGRPEGDPCRLDWILGLGSSNNAYENIAFKLWKWRSSSHCVRSWRSDFKSALLLAKLTRRAMKETVDTISWI